MKNSPSKPKHEPRKDFWDLGDDDFEIEKAPGDHPANPAPVAEPPQALGQDVTSTPPDELDGESSPPEVAPSPAPEAEPPDPGQKRIRIKFTKNDSSSTTVVEKILLVALLGILFGVAAWGVMAYFDNAPNGKPLVFKENFPAKGEQITVATIETWWREPVRTGENPDIGVVVDAELIPCAKIKLAESGSTTIQVSFRDGDDKLIGDTTNLTVQNGKFERTGSDEVSVHATTGFSNPSLINAYVNGDILPWSVAIIESDGNNEPLVRARIEANRKEEK